MPHQEPAVLCSTILPVVPSDSWIFWLSGFLAEFPFVHSRQWLRTAFLSDASAYLFGLLFLHLQQLHRVLFPQ